MEGFLNVKIIQTTLQQQQQPQKQKQAKQRRETRNDMQYALRMRYENPYPNVELAKAKSPRGGGFSALLAPIVVPQNRTSMYPW